MAGKTEPVTVSVEDAGKFSGQDVQSVVGFDAVRPVTKVSALG